MPLCAQPSTHPGNGRQTCAAVTFQNSAFAASATIVSTRAANAVAVTPTPARRRLPRRRLSARRRRLAAQNAPSVLSTTQWPDGNRDRPAMPPGVAPGTRGAVQNRPSTQRPGGHRAISQSRASVEQRGRRSASSRPSFYDRADALVVSGATTAPPAPTAAIDCPLEVDCSPCI